MRHKEESVLGMEQNELGKNTPVSGKMIHTYLNERLFIQSVLGMEQNELGKNTPVSVKDDTYLLK